MLYFPILPCLYDGYRLQPQRFKQLPADIAVKVDPVGVRLRILGKQIVLHLPRPVRNAISGVSDVDNATRSTTSTSYFGAFLQ